MQDSMLTVHVIDGQECCIDRMISPAIKLTVSDNIQTTKVCRPTNEPVWDEDFFFDIKTGKEVLIVSLCDGQNKVRDREI